MRSLLLCLLLTCAAAAPASESRVSSATIEGFVADAAAAAAAPLGAGARVEVELGRVDPQLRLGACSEFEPFVPSSARLWGRTHVGLRCTQADSTARRQVYLPVTVRVYGPALVATRPIAAGQTISADDLTSAEVEWSREPQGVLTDLAQLDGRVLSRPISFGQPIPLAALRAPQVVVAGDQVKIVGRGPGFAVTAQAVAMTAANEGQVVRVRLDSGRILTGTARNGRLVEVVF